MQLVKMAAARRLASAGKKRVQAEVACTNGDQLPRAESTDGRDGEYRLMRCRWWLWKD